MDAAVTRMICVLGDAHLDVIVSLAGPVEPETDTPAAASVGAGGQAAKIVKKKVPADPKERSAAPDNPVKLNKSRITDKGKPLERLGRKAEGLTRRALPA